MMMIMLTVLHCDLVVPGERGGVSINNTGACGDLGQ